MTNATEQYPYLDEEPQYVENGTAAAIVFGNGFTWDTPIWLPDQVAFDLQEAGVIEEEHIGHEWPDGTIVNEFRLAR